MKSNSSLLQYLFAIFCLTAVFFLFTKETAAQQVKRVVILKVDGLSNDFIDHYVKQKDQSTGKSLLPWFEEVFYKKGTRFSNFYSRGMSLSATSWALLDTGQHLQIKGNVEYDRLTFRPYDYLNFIPYFVDFSMKKRVDMPGVEVLDQINVPLLCDAFPYENRYTSYQLLQRGNDLGVIAKGFLETLPKKPREILDEWTIGLDFQNLTVDQNERHIISRVQNRPELNYLDYYTPDFDHISHLNNNELTRLRSLQRLDRTVGRIWLAIQNSARADETALILVSDHGMNSLPSLYSQGFSLVQALGSAEGGGHHIVTKRRLLLDYAIKGLNPFVPLITTKSNNSYYLQNQADYPTIMLDFDGNERSSLHFRNNDLNLLHLIFQQLQTKQNPQTAQALKKAFFEIINRHRDNWQTIISELNEELDALERWVKSQQPLIDNQPKDFTPEQVAQGIDQETRRAIVQINLAREDVAAYRRYLATLNNLLNLKPADFDTKNLKIEDYIAKGAMGGRNSVYELQNYVVGWSAKGLVLDQSGNLDFENSFRKMNYFDLLKRQKVINNVQKELGNEPIDFVAARIPLAVLADKLTADLLPNVDPVWLYGGSDKQALILTRKDDGGNQQYRYLPISSLKQDVKGKISFKIEKISEGFPLKTFEDSQFQTSGRDRAEWLDNWHSEVEWLEATHKSLYSAAVINLNEQMDEHTFVGLENPDRRLSDDENLVRRFRIRQRRLVETDMLILANNHWNFDVRGFNSGGNHGSFFRISTLSALMFAGGKNTAIPQGLLVEKPYDNLSFVPSVLALMGKIDNKNQPKPDLYQLGFRKFPGRIIQEVTAANTPSE